MCKTVTINMTRSFCGMQSLQKGIMKYIVTAYIQNKNDNPITINRIFDNLMFRSVSFLL